MLLSAPSSSACGALAAAVAQAAAAACCHASRRLFGSSSNSVHSNTAAFPTSHPEARAAAAGQPTHSTHPELLDRGELAPGLHHSELQQRRQNLANMMPPNSMALIPASSLSFITGVIPYPYRQDADFLYLTGLQQQAVALIRTGGGWRLCWVGLAGC